MNQEIKDKILETVRGFRLPRYEEIPNVGLYLEQVTKYISECYTPLGNVNITGSMISNYVKRGLVKNPVKKQYNREQIAYLTFIAAAKNVLSLDNIHILINMQKRSFDANAAYNYFCAEFENAIFYVFGLKDSVDAADNNAPDEKVMLRNTIITVAHQTYLNMCFNAVKDERAMNTR